MLIIHDSLSLIAMAVVIALCAICYINVLSKEKCCNWWWKIGMPFEDSKGIMGWLWEPIWGCHKCAAGQMALWAYLIWCLDIRIHAITGSFFTADIVEERPYSFGIHVALILLSILFSAVINEYIQKKNWI
jgi:hypothetical protein